MHIISLENDSTTVVRGMTNQERVAQFHKTFGHPINKSFTEARIDGVFFDEPLKKLRLSLIVEEFEELVEAIDNNDFIEVMDALADLLYVTYGAACVFGIDLTLLKEYQGKTNWERAADYVVHSKFFEMLKYKEWKTMEMSSKSNSPTSKHINEYLATLRYSINQLRDVLSSPLLLSNCVIHNTLESILKNTYIGGVFFAFDLDHAFRLVHESNMTKACHSEEEAKATVEWYKLNKADIYDTPVYKKADSGNYFIVYNESTNKTLKNMNYHAVDLREVLFE